MNTTPAPVTDYVAGLRKWGDYRRAHPTLAVFNKDQTLAQHIEDMRINDLNWRRLVFLGVHDVGARLHAAALLLGFGPDDKPDDETLQYLSRYLRVMYEDIWAERGPQMRAAARALGLPVMR